MEPGSYVMLAVSDTGIGMSAEVQARIFEPFFTTKEVGKGSGLGLSMVYGFVRQSQGQTQIESSLGRGTSIRLYLPRSRADGNVIRPAARIPAVRHEGRNKLVLVVEDDDGVRDYSISALQQLGYRALGAGDGAVALRVLDAEPGIEILFIDVGLPGRSGPDVATEAKRRHAAVKIVFTTGYGDSVELPRDGAGTAYPLLCKPFTAEDLARTLDEVVGA
jgi:CheY-like chemotaxis protein